MKVATDLPENALRDALRHTGAATEREAVEELDRRRRLARLAGELGSFDGFPSREELERS